MKGKSRSYTFRLHPADETHAACIAKLDSILAAIKTRNARRGDLTEEIVEALYSHFFVAKSIPVLQQAVPFTTHVSDPRTALAERIVFDIDTVQLVDSIDAGGAADDPAEIAAQITKDIMSIRF
jgi:hypothetical protein